MTTKVGQFFSLLCFINNVSFLKFSRYITVNRVCVSHFIHKCPVMLQIKYFKLYSLKIAESLRTLLIVLVETVIFNTK